MKYFLIICIILVTWVTFTYLKPNTTEEYIRIDNKKIYVKVAATPEERTKGLMNIEKLKDNHGMLFVFDTESEHNFWMKNTLIPLDIIWLDKNQKIIYIEHNAHPCITSPCQIYSAFKPSKFVLEVNGGYVKSNGITTKSLVDLGL